MKKLYLFIVPIILFFACNQSHEGFTVEGTIKKMGDGEIYFIRSGKEEKRDTVKVVQDKFTFKGTESEPTVYMVNFGPKEQPGFLIIENGKTTLNYEIGVMNSLEVKGGKEQEVYSKFLTECKPIFSQMDSLGTVATANEGNDALLQQLQTNFFKLEEDLKLKQFDFIQKNKTSIAAAFIGVNYLNEKADANIADVDAIYNELDKKVQASYFGTQIADMGKKMKGTSIGQPAPDFTLNDVNDKPISLNSFKGKVTLIDFWASWCGPCRGENPNVVKAYNQFKSKGFEILGVSLDSEKPQWLDAIQKDKLSWTQVSDLKGWSSEVAAMYGVQSIPMNFLLDKDGKIIAKDLRGESLTNKLKEVLP